MTHPLASGGAERAASVAPPTDFLDGFIATTHMDACPDFEVIAFFCGKSRHQSHLRE